MYDLRFSIVEKSKSKGIKKGITIIIVFTSLIIMLISLGNVFTLNPLILVFGSLLFIVAFVVFNDKFKTYNVIGYIEIKSNCITIKKEFESIVIEIWNINYLDFEYECYHGSDSGGGIDGSTIISKDGTGNILEIGTNPTVYKVNCLLENESQAVLLRNYVIKFNKSKQIKNG